MPLVAAFAVGAMTALQARINGQLSVEMGDALEAGVVSFGSGLLILAVMVLSVGRLRRGLARVPAALRAGQLAWWQVLGGLFGGFFVGVQATAVPVVGVAVFTVAVVAGQSANSLVVDRVGLGPAGRQAISTRRVGAAVLAIVAVVIAVANRFGTAGFSAVVVTFAVLAGVGVAVQQAVNGRVALASREPMIATFVNFVGGTSALVIGMVLGWLARGDGPSALPSGPWWIYLGGALGVVFIGLASWVVSIVGVLLLALLSIAGQLSAALTLDVLAPTEGTQLGWNLVIGVVLAFVAVAIAARGRSRA